MTRVLEVYINSITTPTPQESSNYIKSSGNCSWKVMHLIIQSLQTRRLINTRSRRRPAVAVATLYVQPVQSVSPMILCERTAAQQALHYLTCSHLWQRLREINPPPSGKTSLTQQMTYIGIPLVRQQFATYIYNIPVDAGICLCLPWLVHPGKLIPQTTCSYFACSAF